MSDSSPSLLTQTQRNRIRSEFDDVAPAKQRRDERKIRERITAGLTDFEHLSDYPDHQFELAFEECSESEVRAQLADAHLTLERIRVLNDVDRDAVIETARERRLNAADETVASIQQIPLQTRDDWQQQLKTELADEYRPSRWKRLSDVLLKAGLLLVAAVSVLAVVAPDFTNGVGSIPGIIGAGFLAIGLGIVGIRGIKYDLLPATRRFVSDPSGTVYDIWDRV